MKAKLEICSPTKMGLSRRIRYVPMDMHQRWHSKYVCTYISSIHAIVYGTYILRIIYNVGMGTRS